MRNDGGPSLGAKYSPPIAENVKTLPGTWSKMEVGAVSSGGSQEAVAASAGISSWVKMLLLVVLCLQNAIYTMLRRYSVGVIGEKWSKSSVLMVGEIIKLAISVSATLQGYNATGGAAKMHRLVRTSLPMAVPAAVFWLMNLLSYVSLERIDASTFTVCSQMKILATAVFSVILLGRAFHPRKWRALLLMVLGVTLVSTASHASTVGAPDASTATAADASSETASSGLPGEEGHKAINMEYVLGVTAALAQVVLSGFVGVFFEKMLKSKVGDLSVWDRNVQLAMFSIAFYLPVALHEEGALFDGWTWNAIILAVLGSAGGILVAMIMKHLDALLKTFATSGAIVVTAVAGHMLLDDPLNVPIAIGAICTVLSLLNYNESEARATACEECERRKREGVSAAGGVSPPMSWPRSPYNYLPAPKLGTTEYFGAEDPDRKPLIERAVP